MKKFRKNIILSLIALSIGLTSCFEEKDDDYKIIGAVASISVLTVSKSDPIAGEQVTLNIRYYSENVEVNELRLTETIGTGTAAVVQSKTIAGFNVKNSYEDSFAYTVPSVAAGTKILLTVEVKTANDLVNSRGTTLTTK